MRIYPEVTVDEEFATLGGSGTLNDRQFSFLRNLGFYNSLPDMIQDYQINGAASAPTITSPGSITDQPLIGQVVLGVEPTITGAESVAYQWYQGAPTTTPISGATSADYTPVDADYSLTLYRRATYTNATGDTVEDLAAPAVVGKQYADDWASYTAGDTWTQLDTLYNRNNDSHNNLIEVEAGAPAGKSNRLSVAQLNTGVAFLEAAGTFGATNNATKTTYMESLFCFRHIGGNNSRYMLGHTVPTQNWIDMFCKIVNDRVVMEDDTGLSALDIGGVVSGSTYFLRLQLDNALNMKARYWLKDASEPEAWNTRIVTGSALRPSAAFGTEFASSTPYPCVNLLYWSTGYNAPAPYWPTYDAPLPISSDPFTYSASSADTSFSQNSGAVVWTFGDI